MKFQEFISGIANIQGRVRPHRVRPHRLEVCPVRGNADVIRAAPDGQMLPGGFWTPTADWCKNDVLYSWGATAARVLTSVSAVNYRISGMYMEYKNVADPSDVISPPSFDRTGGREYYDALASSPDTDYIRVPTVTTSLDNSDTSLFDDVNRMTFFALSQGVVGVNGKAFSDTANSKVYGGALVAIVDLGDYTQDIVFSRFYFPENRQQVKLATSMVGLEWQIALT